MHPATTLPPEEIIRLHDPANGLDGVIAIHSTRRGPAAGGCRLWSYETSAALATDAMRLAEGMTLKNAMAGLPLGGAKAVLRRPTGAFDRVALFTAFGREVADLNGRYVTAEDVGTFVEDMAWVATRTRHVAGLPVRPGVPGSDPSSRTARGVIRAMEIAVERRLERSLSQTTVAVMGLGHVGLSLCGMLHAAGARLIVAELRSDIAARAAVRFDAEIMSSAAIVSAQADVFAPCAMGAVIDERAVRSLRASVVCGAANNQLATSRQAAQLADRDIFYAPDYLVNAGGIINVAAEYLGWSIEDMVRRVDAIGPRLADILDHAEASSSTPSVAADRHALTLLSAGDVGEQTCARVA